MSSPITPPPTAPKTTLARTIALQNSDVNIDHLKQAMTELDLAHADYVAAEAYYEGKKAEEFSHPRIAYALRKTKDKYKVNFAKTPVNIVADRLRISSVTVNKRTDTDTDADTDTDSTDATPTDGTPAAKKPKNDLTKLFERDVWKKCGLGRLNRELHRKVSEYGDAYYFVWTETEEEADPYDPETIRTVSTNRPVIYYNSPKTTRAIYDPEAPDVVMFVIKRWKHWNGRTRINLYYTDRTEHFELKDGVKPDSQEAGEAKNWEYLGSTPNPYDRIPIFHFRSDMPYGKPEHYDGYGPQDALNKISTTMVHSTEALGFPQRYGLAEPNASLDGGGPGDDWDDENDDRDSDKDNPGGTVEGGPGTIIKLDGMKEVGTFQQGEPKSFLEPAEFYVRALAQTTTTPLRYFYPPGAHPPSGESYRAEDTPLINKVNQRQDDYKETHCEVYAFAMEIVTGTPAEEFAVDVRWAPAASIDDALGWDTVKKKIEAGVPRRQALIEAGYTADQVYEWLQTNSDKSEFQRDVEVLSLLGAAAKNLTDTAHLNGLNPEAVGIVLTEMLQKLTTKKLPLPEKEPEPKHDEPANQPPRDGTDITQPPRLDIPPGGIRPDRAPAILPGN